MSCRVGRSGQDTAMAFGMEVDNINLSTFCFGVHPDFGLLRSLEAKNILRMVQVFPVDFTAFTSNFYGLFQDPNQV